MTYQFWEVNSRFPGNDFPVKARTGGGQARMARTEARLARPEGRVRLSSDRGKASGQYGLGG